MTIQSKYKLAILETICFLYILLFVYAALSKLREFENFQVQVAQSPLLTAYAGYISVAVIVIELIVALMLSFRRTRVVGIFGAFTMMLLFTLYILIILNYSPFVPCSCGGILESMGWMEHLYFNIGFDILAIVGIYLSVEDSHGKFYIPVRLVAISCFSLLLMAVIFLTSEDIVHKRNNFTRRFPPFPAERVTDKDLKFNSFYFAGQSNGSVYLGNSTAPAVITMIDSSLRITQKYQINIKDTLQHFRNIKLRVTPPFFYLYDGTVPCIFKGKLNDMNAMLQRDKLPGFTKAEVVDSSNFIVRTLSKNHEHLLSTIDLGDKGRRVDSPGLLQKQADGIFDTDGSIQYSPELKKFVYLYYYRNQYVVADEKLKLIDRGNTIDTTTKAKVKIVYVKEKKQRTFAAPPLLVNRLSTLHRNLLFINSTLQGKYDTTKMWDNANFIDVYDIISKSYLFTFYVYKVDGEKIDDMIVTDSHLYALLGTKIVVYKLNDVLKKKFIRQ